MVVVVVPARVVGVAVVVVAAVVGGAVDVDVVVADSSSEVQATATNTILRRIVQRFTTASRVVQPPRYVASLESHSPKPCTLS